MVEYFENFLTDQECEEFIKLIEQNKIRSQVVATDSPTTETSEFRTSSTSALDPNNELVRSLHQRISLALNRPLEKGEPLQGQVYEPGQYFKAHTDYFEPHSYSQFCQASGNREQTFMIYLNDVEEGGETTFPNLNLKLTPKKGLAVRWFNMKDGQLDYTSLHEGTPVTRGIKYIITSWWREHKFDHQKDHQLYLESLKG